MGTKLSLLVDRAETPLAVSVASGNDHDGALRLRYRVDRTAASFQAFVYLAVLVHCLRRLLNSSRT